MTGTTIILFVLKIEKGRRESASIGVVLWILDQWILKHARRSGILSYIFFIYDYSGGSRVPALLQSSDGRGSTGEGPVEYHGEEDEVSDRSTVLMKTKLSSCWLAVCHVQIWLITNLESPAKLWFLMGYII